MIADECGHFGCGTECIDDYIESFHIPLIPIKEYEIELEITSIEKGRPDIEVSEEGWDFLEDLFNNPPQAIIDEFKEARKLYENFDWDGYEKGEGVPFPIGDEE